MKKFSLVCRAEVAIHNLYCWQVSCMPLAGFCSAANYDYHSVQVYRTQPTTVETDWQGWTCACAASMHMHMMCTTGTAGTKISSSAMSYTNKCTCCNCIQLQQSPPYSQAIGPATVNSVGPHTSVEKLGALPDSLATYKPLSCFVVLQYFNTGTHWQMHQLNVITLDNQSQLPCRPTLIL